MKQRRMDSFYDSYVIPLVREGAFLSLTMEDLVAMLERAIVEEYKRRKYYLSQMKDQW